MDLSKRKNLEILRRILNIKKAQSLIKIYNASEAFSTTTKSDKEFFYLLQSLSNGDSKIFNRYYDNPKMIKNMNMFLEYTHAFAEFKEAQYLLDNNHVERFNAFASNDRSDSFNSFYNYVKENPTETVLRYYRSHEVKCEKIRKNEINKYKPSNPLSARTENELNQLFENENNLLQNVSYRKGIVRLNHSNNRRFSISEKLKSPITRKIASRILISAFAASLLYNGITGYTNASKYNNFTYNTATQLGYTHNDMNLSQETYDQIQDVQSLFDKYNMEKIPTYNELTALIGEVISVTNNIVSDKTTQAFEHANPGSKVNSVRHSFSDDSRERFKLAFNRIY